MKRRDFIKLGAASAMQAAGTGLLAGSMRAGGAPQAGMPMQGGAAQTGAPPASGADAAKADFTLHIAPVALELAPNHIISTIGYNGTCPGPVLKMKEGVPVTVDVINETETPEFVHWHGLFVPADVDGAEEEGTPAVPPNGRRRFQFTPKPAGTRWYHSHAMAGADLHKGTYTGQFGFLMIDSGKDPGRYDQEVFLALRDWEPFFSNDEMDEDEQEDQGPKPEKPAVLDTRPNGLEVTSMIYSINDKVLGAGEPIRVKPGERVLMHLLNASAIENKRVALPGHRFQVVALDGNPVPTPQFTEAVTLGPGERVDAIVEMSQPGVWILGATDDNVRGAGLGVVLEYANQHREPQWMPPARAGWDYATFGAGAGAAAGAADGASAGVGAGVGAAAEGAPAQRPEQTIDMVFEKIPSGAGKFNVWLVNGKPYPHEQEFVLKQGTRYRLVFHNRTDDSHPLHLHRHSFEIAEHRGKATRGIIKDTVIVPLFGRTAVDFTADQPGLTLFRCHIQQHMDFGFKALFRYA